MKIPKNVSKLELKNSLIESMQKNKMALDYVLRLIHRNEDNLSYNREDVMAQNDLQDLKYIEFVLRYLEDSYRKSAKGIGVNL